MNSWGDCYSGDVDRVVCLCSSSGLPAGSDAGHARGCWPAKTRSPLSGYAGFAPANCQRTGWAHPVRTLLICCVVLSGCISRPDDAAITADLACETARLVLVIRQQPAPASDKCGELRRHRQDWRRPHRDDVPSVQRHGRKLKSVHAV
jgi:hypothetical protein